MTIYAGWDVSDKTTHICVVDGDGTALKRDVVASDPEVLAKWLSKHCSGLVRIVMETGPLSTFLYHGLVERTVPSIAFAPGMPGEPCQRGPTRAMVMTQKAYSTCPHRLVQAGPHESVGDAHWPGSAPNRTQLIATRVAMGNQLRGLLKLFGLRLGSARTPVNAPK